jgi:hypothetical protein
MANRVAKHIHASFFETFLADFASKLDKKGYLEYPNQPNFMLFFLNRRKVAKSWKGEIAMHGKIYTYADVQPDLFFAYALYSLLLLPAELSEPNYFLESVLKLNLVFLIYTICVFSGGSSIIPAVKSGGEARGGGKRGNEGKSVGRQFPISYCQQYMLIMYIMSSSRENRVIYQHYFV